MKPQVLSAKVDLHYSSYDREWYFQEYDAKFNDKVSQAFPTKTQALQAWHENKINWSKI